MMGRHSELQVASLLVVCHCRKESTKCPLHNKIEWNNTSIGCNGQVLGRTLVFALTQMPLGPNVCSVAEQDRISTSVSLPPTSE